MMKKIICFLLLSSFFQLCWSQSEQAYYQLKISGYLDNSGDCGNQRGLRKVFVYYSDGSEKKFHEGSIRNTSFTYEDTFYGKEVTRVFIESSRQTHDIWGCNNHDYTTHNEPVNPGWCYFKRNDQAFGATNGHYQIEITPVITIPSVLPKSIGSEDLLTIGPLTGGVDNAVYNWEYALNNGSFQRFPSTYQNSSQLRILGKNIPGVSDAMHGKPIDIRIDTRCTVSNRYSNTQRYTYRTSSPKVNTVQTTPPSCYDTFDGTATVTLSRNLISGEQINIRILDLNVIDDYDPNGNPNYHPIRNVNATNILNNRTCTINDLPPGRFRFVVSGGINGEPTYAEGNSYYGDATIFAPSPVVFQDIPQNNTIDVYCHGGNDGRIYFSASGGVGGYQYEIKKSSEAWTGNWKLFSSGNSHTESGLTEGTYHIKIKDKNNCVAEFQTGSNQGEEIVMTAIINEPAEALQVVFDTDASADPTAYGFTNGKIKARVFGGTSDNGTYTYEWRDANNILLTTVTEQIVSGQGYFLTLTDIPKGKYYLTVWDKNYIPATYKNTCTVANAEYELFEPDPLEVSIEESESILCNNQNEFADESSNGQLIAHGIGGVRLQLFDNRGLPYYYTWKKQNPDTGVWEVLPISDSIARNLNAGTYSVNIKDANNIVLGDYENNLLVREQDSTYFLKQPELLKISFQKNDITCSSGQDGWAEAFIEGGTPPYQISWSTGETTHRISGLIVGKYVAYVTDANGCQASEPIYIEQPNGLQAMVLEQKNPTCHLGSDGRIRIEASGGVPPYQYVWQNGQTTTNLQGLVAGTYILELLDARDCTTYLEVVLEDPGPLVVDLGENRTLCADQELSLDISISDPEAIYYWEADNGFTSNSPNVSLKQSGVYTATVTTSAGCMGVGKVQIEVSDQIIDADVVVLSQAFTGNEVTLVNVSTPNGELVEWYLPGSAPIEVIEENKDKLKVIFEEPGVYDFTLRTYQGDCYAEYQKTVIVEEAIKLPNVGDTRSPFIEEFIIYPNPTDGNFTVKIALAEAASIALRMFNLTSNSVEMENRKDGQKEYLLEYTMENATGAYLLVLETPKGDEIRKIIFK